MISATEYKQEHTKLMSEYETRVRKWLKKNGELTLADKIPFFKDGVTCPEKWFAPGNNFRPLFILKEVSLGVDRIADVDQFLNTWGNQTTFDFAENPFDDIKIGRFPTWRRIAALAKGLEDLHYGKDERKYNISEFAYKEGGEKYAGDISGYL